MTEAETATLIHFRIKVLGKDLEVALLFVCFFISPCYIFFSCNNHIILLWHKSKLCRDGFRYFSRRLMQSTLLRHKIRVPSNASWCIHNQLSSDTISSCLSPHILKTVLISDYIIVELLIQWAKCMGLWQVNLSQS